MTMERGIGECLRSTSRVKAKSFNTLKGGELWEVNGFNEIEFRQSSSGLLLHRQIPALLLDFGRCVGFVREREKRGFRRRFWGLLRIHYMDHSAGGSFGTPAGEGEDWGNLHSIPSGAGEPGAEVAGIPLRLPQAVVLRPFRAGILFSDIL